MIMKKNKTDTLSYSEKYFNQKIRCIKTDYSAIRAITMLGTYKEIIGLEEALLTYKHLVGLGKHHYDLPTLFHMNDRCKAIKKELIKIAKREDLTIPKK